jgi:hypothetical protein
MAEPWQPSPCSAVTVASVGGEHWFLDAVQNTTRASIRPIRPIPKRDSPFFLDRQIRSKRIISLNQTKTVLDKKVSAAPNIAGDLATALEKIKQKQQTSCQYWPSARFDPP